MHLSSSGLSPAAPLSSSALSIRVRQAPTLEPEAFFDSLAAPPILPRIVQVEAEPEQPARFGARVVRAVGWFAAAAAVVATIFMLLAVIMAWGFKMPFDTVSPFSIDAHADIATRLAPTSHEARAVAPPDVRPHALVVARDHGDEEIARPAAPRRGARLTRVPGLGIPSISDR